MKKTKKVLFFILILAILLAPIYGVSAAFAPAMPTHIRVGLVDRFSDRSVIKLNNTSIFYGSGFMWSASGFFVRPYGSGQVALYHGDHIGGRLGVFFSGTLFQDAYGGPIWLEGLPFRGAVEFSRIGGGSGITAVNIVHLEEYLFSVVPSEMPASWHPEALKAQAVAARTYALNTLTQGSRHTGFDLCNTVCCQVYRGIEWEHESTNQAVLATAGLAIYHSGRLIDAVYFASSGGATENSENVWLEPRPYLRSVTDHHEFEPVIWHRTFSMQEITQLLAQNNRSIGSAVSVAIAGVHPSGRVESLVIQGTAGQVTLQREEVRTFFAPSEEGSLRSRMFVISGTDFIVISGRGFGHGVGMSQRGAEGMARMGFTFRDILTHFYSGVVIQ